MAARMCGRQSFGMITKQSVRFGHSPSMPIRWSLHLDFLFTIFSRPCNANRAASLSRSVSLESSFNRHLPINDAQAVLP